MSSYFDVSESARMQNVCALNSKGSKCPHLGSPVMFSAGSLWKFASSPYVGYESGGV